MMLQVMLLSIVQASIGAGEDAEAVPLPGTEPLTAHGDLAADMVAGIGRFLDRELAASVERRQEFWDRDLSSHAAYVESVAPNRDRFRTIIGIVDDRMPPTMVPIAAVTEPAILAEADAYTVRTVRWPVLEGVHAEGILLEPRGDAVANVVALPDCDWTPEMLAGLTEGAPARAQFARRLGENGCRVLVPMLIDRRDTYSGNPAIRMTNQPHREFVYRAAFQMGRHVIGYEVQKVLAAVDWFSGEFDGTPIGVMGYGEGGLVALYAAAADTRIDAAAVSGYFQPRERVWAEPIYRNVWALLQEFGDAEIASIVAPRPLVIEACRHPEVSGPPQTKGRAGAAPGVITTPDVADVKAEVERARASTAGLGQTIEVVAAAEGKPGNGEALETFLKALGADEPLAASDNPARVTGSLPDPEARMKRQFDELVGHTQRLMRESEFRRAEFWSKADATDAGTWEERCAWYRDYLWDEVVGRFPPATEPARARSRKVYDEPGYTGYEVCLDVYPDVFAYGILLLPKGMKPNERRPVVVCQHGLEGRPQSLADPDVNIAAYGQYGCKLADRGYVVFAPQNPYIGGDAFRVLQRKANPLKKSLFAVIVRQHERILEWMAAQPFADADRLAFYGISYGGKTAMRVPALLPQYCLSICSADFNEWIWKTVSVSHKYSYMFTGEYEMDEFGMGDTFNHAEMSWLIFPRPFMVERGHHDGVAPDEWVGYEFARTWRRYDLLGLGDRAEIEYFDGPHKINGVGTFAFLDKHLDWTPQGGQQGVR
jgi:dienelactone hydrolase